MTDPATKQAQVILTRANELIGGDRASSHGPASLNFANIAREWSHYLRMYRGVNFDITTADVAMMMARMKDARTLTAGPPQGGIDLLDDNAVDAAAYAAFAGAFRR